MGWPEIKSLIQNKSVLEVGGPSHLFEKNNDTSLYDIITPDFLVEQESFEDGFNEKVDIKNQTYFGDCVEESSWKSLTKQYQVVLSSHVIEHLANPIKFLKLAYHYTEKYILTICPDYSRIWDKHRQVTSLDHMIWDYTARIEECDISHLHESYVTEHPWHDSPEHWFKFFNNKKYRVIHHHVFDPRSLQKIHEYVGFKSLFLVSKSPHHIIYLGEI
jgi:hypothetical protein